jgi:twinfilin-like protein
LCKRSCALFSPAYGISTFQLIQNNTVLFISDVNEEKIHLADVGNISTDKLSQKIPSDCARYHLYSFNHTHEGGYIETVGMFYLLMCS